MQDALLDCTTKWRCMRWSAHNTWQCTSIVQCASLKHTSPAPACAHVPLPMRPLFHLVDHMIGFYAVQPGAADRCAFMEERYTSFSSRTAHSFSIAQFPRCTCLAFRCLMPPNICCMFVCTHALSSPSLACKRWPTICSRTKCSRTAGPTRSRPCSPRSC